MRKIVSLTAMLLLFFTMAIAQTRSVSGRVVDGSGDPVPFATISVKGTKITVVADADAAFRIKANTGDVLVVQAIGHETKEVTVGAGNTVSVVLTRSTANLGEVVVTTGLGIQKQAKSLGYATEKVSGADADVAKPISVANGLTGKVSGLEISTTNNGLFAPTRITLRGERSLTGNNQPLIVVDGSIFYNDISTLNPEDISDISVLKGSSAAAIYGSDASNGVLLITTKHGNRSKPVITFSTTEQLETVCYLPSFQTQFGNSGGEYYLYNYTDLNTYIPFENQSYGPMFDGKMVPAGRPIADGSVQMIPYSAYPNEKKDFFNKGFTTQNNFSYSAGDDNSRFYLSAQDIKDLGVMPGDLGRRDVFRVGGSKTDGIFTADYTLSYTYTRSQQTNTGSVYIDVLDAPVNDPLPEYKNWQSGKYSTPDGYYNDYFQNPYWVAGNVRYLTTNNNLQGNAHLQLKPTNWLTLSYRLSMNNLSQKYENTNGAAAYSNHSFSDDTVYFSNAAGTAIVPNTNWGSKWIASNNGNVQPSYNTSTYTNLLVTSDFVASANKDITKKLNVNGSVGTTYIDNQIDYFYANANSIFFPVYNVGSLTGIPSLTQTHEEARKLGFFGDAQLGWDGFLYLHGSYRSDIDSRLSQANRFIPYYDVDASIVLSELIPSLKSSQTFNYLKIRGAYSVTGNVTALGNGSQYIADGAYKTVPTLASAAGYGFPYNGLGGYLLNSVIDNPNIKPEQITEKEIGLETGFLKDRITFGVSAYDQKLANGVVSANLPNSSGYTQAILNAANTDNKGIEVDLKGNIVKNRDWTWGVGVNFSYNKSKVLSINGGQTSLGIGGNSYAVVGQQFPVLETNDFNRTSTGQVIVNPVTGDPSINPNLKVEGNANPNDILGVSSHLSYKRLTLTVTADYRGGYKVYNYIGQFMAFTGASSYTAAVSRQRFVFPNSVVEENGKYVTNTNITTDDGNYNFWPGVMYNTGSPFIASGSFWKIREVALNYNIPKSVYQGVKIIQAASLTLSGRNLFMFRPKTNQWTDPEFSDAGTGNAVGTNSYNEAPPTRIVSATLSVTF